VWIADGVPQSILFVNIIILTIITAISIEGYIRLRERNTKLLSLSFLSLLLGNILSIIPWFSVMPDPTIPITITFIGNIFNILAIVIIVYAFYLNKNFNQVVLKRSHLLIIISATLVASLAMGIISYNSYFYTEYYPDWIRLVLVYEAIEVFGWMAISIPLIVLLVMLIKYYIRTKNTNTLFIITGFSAILLVYTFPGMLLFVNIVNAFQWNGIAYSTINGLIALIAYLSFLVVLIRTR
jgi:hypothetical protein